MTDTPQGDKNSWDWAALVPYTPLSTVDSFDNSPEWLNGTETDPLKFDISDCDMTYYGTIVFATLTQGTRLQKGGSGYCIQVPVTTGGSDGVRALYKTSKIEAILNGDIMGSTIMATTGLGTPGKFMHLIFRYIDDNNFYELRVRLGNSPATLWLVRVIGGVTTTLAAYNLSSVVNAIYDIRCIFLNNTYYIYYAISDNTLNGTASKAWIQAGIYNETTGGFINPGRVGWHIISTYPGAQPYGDICMDDFNVKAISVDTYDGA